MWRPLGLLASVLLAVASPTIAGGPAVLLPVQLAPPPPPADAEAIWFVLVAGQPVGPMTIEDVRARIASGETGTTDYVWQPAFADWRRVEAVAELKPQGLTPPPAPVEAEEPIAETTVVEAPKVVNPACAGLDAWAEATRARFLRIADLQDEGGDYLMRLDMPAYRASLRAFASEVTQMAADQTTQPAPAVAAEAQALAIKSIDLYVAAARGLTPPTTAIAKARSASI